jgi:hypothetical protein
MSTATAAELPAIVTASEEQRYAELQLIALDHARCGETEPLVAMASRGPAGEPRRRQGNSLLMLATYHGHAETALMLLGHGSGCGPSQ